MTDVGGRPVLLVVDPGPSLLVQDLGRPGWAHVGVPSSGAADPGALALANRLVGNPDGAAGLEVLLGPIRLRVLRSTTVAVTGAPAGLLVDGRPAAWGAATPAPAGADLELRPPALGLRSWLAVAGGLVAPRVLGSASTDTLTGLGPPPVRAGDELRAGPAPPAPAAAQAVPSSYADAVSVRVWLGPRHHLFTAAAVERLAATAYTVSARSDRVGVRLEAADGGALERRDLGELESEGVVTGAVQVPPSGQPLVFLADHPVTGGFPVIAVVDAADLPGCAQLRPGNRLRFVVAG